MSSVQPDGTYIARFSYPEETEAAILDEAEMEDSVYVSLGLDARFVAASAALTQEERFRRYGETLEARRLAKTLANVTEQWIAIKAGRQKRLRDQMLDAQHSRAHDVKRARLLAEEAEYTERRKFRPV